MGRAGPTSVTPNVSHTAAPAPNLSTARATRAPPNHHRPTKPWARRRPIRRHQTARASGGLHTTPSTHPISSRARPAAANHSPGIRAVPANQLLRPCRRHLSITMAAGSVWTNQAPVTKVKVVTLDTVDQEGRLNRLTGVEALTSVAPRLTSRHPYTTRLIDLPPPRARRPIRASDPRNPPANHSAAANLVTNPAPPKLSRLHRPALPAPPAPNNRQAPRRRRRRALALWSGTSCTRWIPTCPTRSSRRGV